MAGQLYCVGGNCLPTNGAFNIWIDLVVKVLKKLHVCDGVSLLIVVYYNVETFARRKAEAPAVEKKPVEKSDRRGEEA
jgi:hypothetical protein